MNEMKESALTSHEHHPRVEDGKFTEQSAVMCLPCETKHLDIIL
jgi:hypothetical protein